MSLITALAVLAAAACSPPRAGGDRQDSAAQGADKAGGGTVESVLLGSCCAPGDSALRRMLALYDSVPPAGRTPELAVFPHWSNSNIGERTRIIVADSATWTHYWRRITSNSAPPSQLPAVDFSREMLIIASSGTKATGGFGIFIDSAWVEDDTLRVSVHETKPGPECGTTSAITTPLSIARIRRSTLPLQIVESATTIDCTAPRQRSGA